jgi:hypothetical protein
MKLLNDQLATRSEVYRLTIAPLDHPVAFFTEVSDTPARNALMAIPLRQA